MTAQPLIITARIDEDAFLFFEGLRRLHFPVERNFLRAHLTLFHSLPAEELHAISDDLHQIAASTHHLGMKFTGWRSLGRGVAMNVESQGLAAVRSEIASRWAATLKPQDRQPFRPHITVQNKVEPAIAKELLEQLSGDIHPIAGTAVGLELWRYLNGPWESVAFYKFTK